MTKIFSKRGILKYYFIAIMLIKCQAILCQEDKSLLFLGIPLGQEIEVIDRELSYKGFYRDTLYDYTDSLNAESIHFYSGYFLGDTVSINICYGHGFAFKAIISFSTDLILERNIMFKKLKQYAIEEYHFWQRGPETYHQFSIFHPNIGTIELERSESNMSYYVSMTFLDIQNCLKYNYIPIKF